MRAWFSLCFGLLCASGLRLFDVIHTNGAIREGLVGDGVVRRQPTCFLPSLPDFFILPQDRIIEPEKKLCGISVQDRPLAQLRYESAQ
jgi:hypothetical protein